MPALIPTNTFICQNIQEVILQFHPQHSPELPQASHKYQHSDVKLHQNLDDQIQLVKKLQKLLMKEDMKLELMLKLFHARNENMNHGTPVKKRRGRPPGSKTKKKIEAKNKKTFKDKEIKKD